MARLLEAWVLMEYIEPRRYTGQKKRKGTREDASTRGPVACLCFLVRDPDGRSKRPQDAHLPQQDGVILKTPGDSKKKGTNTTNTPRKDASLTLCPRPSGRSRRRCRSSRGSRPRRATSPRSAQNCEEPKSTAPRPFGDLAANDTKSGNERGRGFGERTKQSTSDKSPRPSPKPTGVGKVGKPRGLFQLEVESFFLRFPCFGTDPIESVHLTKKIRTHISQYGHIYNETPSRPVCRNPEIRKEMALHAYSRYLQTHNDAVSITRWTRVLLYVPERRVCLKRQANLQHRTLRASAASKHDIVSALISRQTRCRRT